MAAPKANTFWKQRSKHGRDKLFESPDLLWEAATEYFTWCDQNPWQKVEQLKKPTVTKDKNGKVTLHSIVKIPTQRPYTLSGLCLYLGCDTSYFRAFKSQDRVGADDFITVITRIEETIYTQKFEGATVGAFNANIIARDLGLADKKEISGSMENGAPDLSRLTDAELDQYIMLQEKLKHG